jgi:Zn-dependent M16 (insulinase) family peptidase
VEFVVRAAGNDAEESQVAVGWLASVLFDPDWSAENLPRIRDVVDLALSSLRNTMRRSEESWVMDPANAYWRQTNPLILTTDCFLTQTHALHRLRWRLKDPGSPATFTEFSAFMDKLAVLTAQADRNRLLVALTLLQGKEAPAEKLIEAVSRLKNDFDVLAPAAQILVRDAAKDLQQTLADLPDGSLGTDWAYLCHQMDTDLAVSPEAALADLRSVMQALLHSDNVRTFLISNSSNQKALEPRVQAFLSKLETTPSNRQVYDRTPRIIARLRERTPNLNRPVFVGLLNENTRSGVFINSVKGASFVDFDRESLVKFLSSRLYGGHGAHSMFMKTWSAGLAYSNGLRYDESAGRLIYYAERCPDLAQTMQFVVNELKNAPYDTSLGEYAIAKAFAAYRSGSSYEERGEAMAADLEDGVTPDAVRRFRQGVLALRDSHDLYGNLHSRMEFTYGEVLPGYGQKKADGSEAIYFIIGPEKQFRSYEEYLRSVEGDVAVHRLYPRDYWLVK